LKLIIINFSYEYSTGAAIAFPAANLCTGKMLMIPDEIKQYHSQGQISADFFFVQDKAYQSIFVVLGRSGTIKNSQSFL
jgi:hypothetical protein